MLEAVVVINSLSVLLFLYAAWTDFRTWKILNTVVLALMTLYALRAVVVLLGSDDVARHFLLRAELAVTSGPVC